MTFVRGCTLDEIIRIVLSIYEKFIPEPIHSQADEPAYETPGAASPADNPNRQ